MRLYIGGKMLGVVGYGFAEFDVYSDLLRAQGHTVFNPADHDRSQGFSPAADADGSVAEMTDSGFNRRAAIGADLAWITSASEGMVVLDNWTDSPGCKAEVAAHQALYLPVWHVEDFLWMGTQAEPIPSLVPSESAYPDPVTVKVVDDTLKEVDRQLSVWGEQHHPDGTSKTYTGHADWARRVCKQADNEVTWRHILAEEFYEACAETDWLALRGELIQSAAVIFSWVRDGDKRET
jgi:hypothetical protein